MSQTRERITKNKTKAVKKVQPPDDGVGAPWATPPVPSAVAMKSHRHIDKLIDEVLS